MRQIEPQLKIRLPKALKEWIEAQARTNCRSQNSEIVYRLEQMKKQQEAA